jgi:hypothetical protein
MNSATRGALLAVVDTTGRPLFQPALSAPNCADALGTLLGRPVVLDQFAPNIAATNKAIAFGDFKAGYTLRNVGQFQIVRDPYTYLISKEQLRSSVTAVVVRTLRMQAPTRLNSLLSTHKQLIRLSLIEPVYTQPDSKKMPIISS